MVRNSLAQAAVILGSFLVCSTLALHPARAGAPLHNVATGALGTSGSIAGGLAGIHAEIDSGPAGTVSGGSGATGGVQPFASSSGNLRNDTSLIGMGESLSAALAVMSRQQILGKVIAVGSNSTVVLQAGAGTRTLRFPSAMTATFHSLIGRVVLLRSVDGAFVNAIVGRNDILRATVTSVNHQFITLLTPIGLVEVIKLAYAFNLPIGSRVLATSHDFDKTVRLRIFSTARPSSLTDIFIGSVGSVSNNIVSMHVGPMVQLFSANPAALPILNRMVGKIVAVDSPDGAHVKSVVASAMLNYLIRVAASTQTRNAGVSAIVLSRSRDAVTVQFPNGDIRSFHAASTPLAAEAGAAVRVEFLDNLHARVRAGTRVANVLDADACVTINARCEGSLSGRVVSIEPGALAVQLRNGDVVTLLGQVTPAVVTVGARITAKFLSRTHARVVIGANVLNLTRADACVTINAGCHSAVGTLSANEAGRVAILLPNGTKTVLLGTLAGVTIGTPLVLQPLDATHAVVVVGAAVSDLALANACVTINAACPATSSSSGGGSGGGSSGGTGAGGGSGGGTGAGGPPCVPFGSAASASATCLAMNLNALLAYAYSGLSCGTNGQVITHVIDPKTGKPIRKAIVRLDGAGTIQGETSSDGSIIFLGLNGGDYRATIEHIGYDTLRTRPFPVSCHRAVVLNVRLRHVRTSKMPSLQTSSLVAMRHLTEEIVRNMAPHTVVCSRITLSPPESRGRRRSTVACTQPDE